MLYGKVSQILWACRLKMGARNVTEELWVTSRQRDVSVNSRVLEVAYNALSVYLGNISFWSL